VFFSMSGSSPTNIWAVGLDSPRGAVSIISFAVRYDGTAWTRVPDPTGDHSVQRAFGDVAVATPDQGATWIAAGQAGERYDGTSWTTFEALLGMNAIDVRGTQMFAVGMDGRVMRWTAATGWTVDRTGAPMPALP
jgi:hypothetical protein